MQKIRLTKGLKLKVKQTVWIKDNCYNMPSVGQLYEGTVVQVTGGPTSLSDVPFKVIDGSGGINYRIVDSHRGEIEKPSKITSGEKGFFFTQGHDTCAPYDYGHLSPEFYEVYND